MILQTKNEEKINCEPTNFSKQYLSSFFDLQSDDNISLSLGCQ